MISLMWEIKKINKIRKQAKSNENRHLNIELRLPKEQEGGFKG